MGKRAERRAHLSIDEVSDSARGHASLVHPTLASLLISTALPPQKTFLLKSSPSLLQWLPAPTRQLDPAPEHIAVYRKVRHSRLQ